MKNFDIHRINRKLELAIENVKKSHISNQDRTDILEFYNYACSIGLSKHRILKYLNLLRNLSTWLDSTFKKASKKDIMKLIRKIEQKDYSEWTKKDYKMILKRFYKWLDGDEEYPEKVKWIKTTFRKNNHKLPEDLITKQDIEKMINVANHTRDKALIALIYESGFRVSEVLTLQIKHIKFDEFGAKIVGSGKTGMRRIRLVLSVPYLSSWVENHPFRDTPESPLWLRIGTTNMEDILYYNNARKIIRNCAKKANIRKRIHPHLFRHSRATYLANHMTEAQMNQYFGWVQGSDMPSTYVHLSGRDLDSVILEINGLKEEEKGKGKEATIKKCYRCEKMNTPDGKFCLRCGTPLDPDTALTIENERKKSDELIIALLKDPEIHEFIERKLKLIKV